MFIDFKPWHLDMMRLANDVQALVGKVSPATLVLLAARGFAFTLVAEEGEQVKILGVVGAVPRGEDGMVGEVFVIASEEKRRHVVAFSRGVRRVLRAAAKKFTGGIEALGDDSPEIDRWLGWLGFKRVGGAWPRAKTLWRLA